jgi:hypothetical protein
MMGDFTRCLNVNAEFFWGGGNFMKHFLYLLNVATLN